MLSIQYVYERVFNVFRLFLKAGAKVQLLFNLASVFEKKLKFLFLFLLTQ